MVVGVYFSDIAEWLHEILEYNFYGVKNMII